MCIGSSLSIPEVLVVPRPKHHSEVEHDPVPVEPIHRSNGERNAQKENEKQFREKVDLLVEKRHFVAWKSLVHLRACLSSCVDDKAKDNMRRSKDCICPH